MPNIENLKKYKKIHMIGIGGVSMSGIAAILNNWGFHVTGSDWTNSETTDKLKDWIFTENESAQTEQDFAFKYLFMPYYRQVISDRTLYAYTTSDQLFKTIKNLKHLLPRVNCFLLCIN